MPQRLREFLALLALVIFCMLIGVFGAVFAKRLVSFRLKNLKNRNIEKIAPSVVALIQILSLAVILLSGYLLIKMPEVYNHCVRPKLTHTSL